jgi:spermidine synthase
VAKPPLNEPGQQTKDLHYRINISKFSLFSNEVTMDLWFSETHPIGTRFSFKVQNVLHHEKSPYQEMDIIATENFGSVMLLDDKIMLTEKDEFVYHEMIVHVPMAVNPGAKDILIIGGGDGGTARELLKYKSVAHIDLVDIDEMVSRAAKLYFPQLAPAFADSRLHTHYTDGIRFVAETAQKYDLIIIDSTDPIGPGEGLFTSDFFRNCKQLLNAGGCLINQSENPQWDDAIVRSVAQKLSNIFANYAIYQAFIPVYPSGQWLFSFASDSRHPIDDFDAAKWQDLNLTTRYYNTDVHTAAFALPNFVRKMIDG